ncbi:MAG: radical SAM protein [Patescibacteria group bacterium]|nr:radical SAM protein [Patescibacteria group bacterium]
MEKSSYMDLVIAITYQCNSRCRMCNIWRKNLPGSIKADNYDKLPRDLSNINITGGEPFLRNDLEQVLAAIHKASPKAAIIISTNGFATDLIIKQVEKIKKIIPDLGVAISLDGIGNKHDEIRGVPGGFNKAMSTISALKKVGLKNLRLAFTLGDYNIDELAKVYNLSRELGIEMTLSAVHSSEKYFNASNAIEKKQEMAKALDWLIKRELKSYSVKRWLRAYFAFGLKEFILTGQRILPDYSGKYSLFMDPTGDIYPSDVSGQKIGDLRGGFNNLAPVFADEKPNWMICTARMAIRRHWPKFIFWFIKNNFLTVNYEDYFNK